MHYSELHPSLPDWMRDINSLLVSFVAGESTTLQQAGKMVIGTRGKRLRPIMLALCCASVGEVTQRALTFGALVEMIHTASLAHDDVVDEADSRRGDPSAPAFWGNKLSVLVGDYLLARVFETAAHDGEPRLLHLLSAAATEMGRAVVLECAEMGIDASEETYFAVIGGKTAALFSAAAAIGANLGGATPEQEQALSRLGHSFGQAFQLADDLLDLQGKESDVGKPLGADWAQRRATLPLLHSLRTAPDNVAREIRDLWHREPFTPAHLRAMMYLVETVGGMAYGWDKVKAFREQACANLEDIPAGPGRDALRHLCTDAFPLPVLPVVV
jgi:octaprenyl-diphosphate synthase